MPGLERLGDPASCGHPNTGSTTVFVNGRGVTKVVYDVAGSVIIGPGSQTVFAEGYKVSLPGDAVAGHGIGPHAAPITSSPSLDVFAGTGFIGSPGGTQPRPDLVTTSFNASLLQANTSGEPEYPPIDMVAARMQCNLGTFLTSPQDIPFVEFTFSVRNNGQEPAQPFSVGFWELPTKANGGLGILGAQGVNLVVPATQITYQDPSIQHFYDNVRLIDSISFGALAPNHTVTGTFLYPERMLLSQQEYNFGLYADIYLTTTEPNENNSTQVITIPVTPNC